MGAPLDVRIVDNLSPPDWWTIGLTSAAVLLSAILGAAIGAYVSYLIAKRAARDNLEAMKAAQRSAEEAATLRAIVKLMSLVNGAAGYHFQIEREIEEVKKKTGGREPETWAVMVPRIGKPKEIDITADDLVAFVRSRKFEYVTDLLHVVSLYNSMIFGFEGYGRKREELNDRLTPDEMDGALGSKSMTREEFMKVAPYLVAVKQLADHLRQEAKEVYEAAVKTVEGFGPVVRAYFNDPKFPIPGLIDLKAQAAASGNSAPSARSDALTKAESSEQ